MSSKHVIDVLGSINGSNDLLVVTHAFHQNELISVVLFLLMAVIKPLKLYYSLLLIKLKLKLKIIW